MHRGGGAECTNRCGAGIEAVLDKLLAYRLEVNNDLPGLDLMNGATFDGLDGGHIRPHTPRCVAVQVMTRRRDEG
jgi:hypothetical protein